MPTARYGAVGTYNQEVGVPLEIDDAIDILSPQDVPILSRIGTESTTAIKVEWLNEELTPQSATIDSVTGTDSPWTVDVGTDDVAWFRPGDIVYVEGAASTVQYTVTSIDTGAGTIVLAGFNGNTVDPVAADVLVIVGQYRDEGSDPEEMRSTDRGEAYNLTQIFQEGVEATRTARIRQLIGQGDPYDHEVEKKFRELRIRWERAVIHGQRVQSVDEKKRSMGGLLFFITTANGAGAESGVKANVYSLFNALMRKSYDKGGSGSQTLWVSPSIKAAISANVDVSLRRSDRSETTGGYTIERLLGDFGEVNLVVDRFLPKTKAILTQDEFITRVTMTPAFHEVLAKTGDRDEGHIVEESTLKVKHPEVMGVLTVTDA